MRMPDWMWAQMNKAPKHLHNEAREWRRLAYCALCLFAAIFVFLIYVERDTRRIMSEEDAAAKITVAQLKGEQVHVHAGKH
jgi:cytochrome bd-type quinol oxidase subunit 2